MKTVPASNAPIRVAHLVNSLEMGGMENGVVNICRKLQGNGFQFEVICLNCRGEFADRLPPDVSLRVIGKTQGFSFRATMALGSILRSTRPRILHTHNLGPLIYGVMGSICQGKISILHGEHDAARPATQAKSQLLYRHLLYPFVAGLHSVGKAQLDSLRQAGYPAVERFVPLVNGTDTDRFIPGNKTMARRRVGLPEDGLLLGMVARFDRFKRHAMVVSAFSSIALADPRVHLVLVGDGPERPAIEAMILTNAFKDRIHLAGAQGDVLPYFQSLDLLLVPGVNEGLSNALLEAMACSVVCLVHRTAVGHAVVASGVTGFDESIEDEAKLASLLLAIIGRADLGEIGERAREHVVNHYSLDAMARRYAKAYEKIDRNGRLSRADIWGPSDADEELK